MEKITVAVLFLADEVNWNWERVPLPKPDEFINNFVIKDVTDPLKAFILALAAMTVFKILTGR